MVRFGRVEQILFICLCLNWSASVHGMDLCSQSFCQCPEAGKAVTCTCSNPSQNININEESIPIQAQSLHISDCGSVDVRPNSFARCLDLDYIGFKNLKELEFRPKFYATSSSDFKEIRNFTIAHVGRVTIHSGAFVHFPKSAVASFHEVGIREVLERDLEILTDVFSLTNSEIGVLGRASLYSDAGLLEFRNNRIEVIQSGAFDASVRKFDFIGNTIDFIENTGMSVACLHGRIIGNIFHNQTGSPLLDFGPDPVCIPDPEAESEEDMQYNVVANPILEFTDNFFHTFDDDLLKFPGASNVPLGSLDIRGNKVKCDCESLKELAALVDFEHIVPRDHTLELGAVLFRKEFYDTGICVDANGQEQSLKGFARNWIKVVEPGTNGRVVCSPGPDMTPKKLRKSTSTNDSESGPDVEESQKEAFEMNPSTSSASSRYLSLMGALSISLTHLSLQS
eukprot:maker-scaffold14_size734282-snap-gene-3.15 protein:Tk11297 transcript:maker-scaffold14_size734282-snap-gene-3.15-mRNA-1 annotation:"PREDICTED: nyctalopin-like"